MRFKELRGLLITAVFTLADIVLLIMSLNEGNRAKLMVGLGLSLLIVFMFLTQFYIRLLDDCMMIYKGAVILLLPVIVDYKDIEEMKLTHKFILQIKANGRSYRVYSFKAGQIQTMIEERRKIDE